MEDRGLRSAGKSENIKGRQFYLELFKILFNLKSLL